MKRQPEYEAVRILSNRGKRGASPRTRKKRKFFEFYDYNIAELPTASELEEQLGDISVWEKFADEQLFEIMGSGRGVTDEMINCVVKRVVDEFSVEKRIYCLFDDVEIVATISSFLDDDSYLQDSLNGIVGKHVWMRYTWLENQWQTLREILLFTVCRTTRIPGSLDIAFSIADNIHKISSKRELLANLPSSEFRSLEDQKIVADRIEELKNEIQSLEKSLQKDRIHNMRPPLNWFGFVKYSSFPIPLFCIIFGLPLLLIANLIFFFQDFYIKAILSHRKLNGHETGDQLCLFAFFFTIFPFFIIASTVELILHLLMDIYQYFKITLLFIFIFIFQTKKLTSYSVSFKNNSPRERIPYKTTPICMDFI